MYENKTFKFDNFRIIDGNDISTNEINSMEDLEKLNNKIKTRIRFYRLDALLLKIHNMFLSEFDPDFNQDFIAGIMTKFALLNCNVYDGWDSVYDEEISILRRMITEYSIYDYEFEKERKLMVDQGTRLTSLLLRKIGSQARWDVRYQNVLGRTLFLYTEMLEDEKCPIFFNELVIFRFEDKFGLSLLDFIKIGFLTFAKSKEPNGMDREYFEIARKEKIPIPNDEIIKKFLKQVACDPFQFKKLCRSEQPIGEHYSAYKFNPLFNYPLIRPWKDSDQKKPIEDKFIAPVPNLVFYRFTTGLYYQLSDNFDGFTEAFGKIFEIYIGKLLDWFKLPGKVLSEDEIKTYLPRYKGKKPDYIVFLDESVVLIECKATKYTQDMYENGLEAKAKSCIDQISKAIIQMNEFENQISLISKAIGINCADLKVKKVIVSFDNFLGLKEGPFRDWINRENKNKGIQADWQILWVGYLEIIQPYITKGADFWYFLLDFDEKPFNKIIEEIKSKTNAKYSEGFLFKYQKDFLNKFTKNEAIFKN